MSRRPKLLLQLLILAVALGTLVWTIVLLGPGEVLDAALAADLRWLGLSLVPVIGRFVIWAYKWHRMLRREAPIRYADTQRMMLAGTFVNLTTPTAKLGGGLLRAVLLYRAHGWRLSVAFGWVLADQVTNVLGGMLMYGVLALGAGLASSIPGRSAFTVSGLVALTLIGVALALRGRAWVAVQDPELARSLARRLPRRWRESGVTSAEGGGVARLFAPLLQRRTGRESIWTDIAGAALSFAALCVANACVLRALGLDVALWIVAVAVAIGYFAGNGLGPWGGIGVTEAAMTGVFLELGIPGDTAAAGVLLHRASYYLVTLLWGGIAFVREGRAARFLPF